MTTLRAHLEAIASYWESCPAVVMEHTGAALAILDRAERLGHLGQRIYPQDERVAIPDPQEPS